MNFRRLPFQFSASNPAERQAELMRRFGVSNDNKVHESNSSLGGSTSPRLQCRLPKSFSEKESMRFQAGNVDSAELQPRVRVIPIQVEGQKDYKSNVNKPKESTSSVNVDMGDEIPETVVTNGISHGVKGSKESSNPSIRRVRSIPVVVEGKEDKKMKSSSCVNVPVQTKSDDSGPSRSGNGPGSSKPKIQKKNSTVKPEQQSLLEIASILKDFEIIKGDVEKFMGTQNDKQYCYLDEMMTRSMLKLDGIETYGNEEVRKARKAAIKTVQDCINSLESKALKLQEISAKLVDAKDLSNKVELMDTQVELVGDTPNKHTNVVLLSNTSSPVASTQAPLGVNPSSEIKQADESSEIKEGSRCTHDKMQIVGESCEINLASASEEHSSTPNISVEGESPMLPIESSEILV